MDNLKLFDSMGNLFQNTKRGMLMSKTAPVDVRIETSEDGFTTMSFTYAETMILVTLTDEIKKYLKEVIK